MWWADFVSIYDALLEQADDRVAVVCVVGMALIGKVEFSLVVEHRVLGPLAGPVQACSSNSLSSIIFSKVAGSRPPQEL